MKKIDRPLGKLEDTPQWKIAMLNGEVATCWICKSKDTYDIFYKNDIPVVMNYNRGSQLICKRCYRDSIFFDNIMTAIMIPILKIKRRLGV